MAGEKVRTIRIPQSELIEFVDSMFKHGNMELLRTPLAKRLVSLSIRKPVEFQRRKGKANREEEAGERKEETLKKILRR
ncbi:MAG: hypothetical protein QXT64_02475 [Desulfurococcaceae archaeon]